MMKVKHVSHGCKTIPITSCGGYGNYLQSNHTLFLQTLARSALRFVFISIAVLQDMSGCSSHDVRFHVSSSLKRFPERTFFFKKKRGNN